MLARLLLKQDEAGPRNLTPALVLNLIISAYPTMTTFTAVKGKNFRRNAKTIASAFLDLVMRISKNAGVPHQRSVMVATMSELRVFELSTSHLSLLKFAA